MKVMWPLRKHYKSERYRHFIGEIAGSRAKSGEKKNTDASEQDDTKSHELHELRRDVTRVWYQ